MLIWITGLSGSGKTTVAKALCGELRREGEKSVSLDGDELRDVFANKDTSFEGRRELAFTYAKLGKLISDQGNITIISTISMFEDIRKWNRSNNKSYLEVYLKVSENERRQRDPKKLYSEGESMVDIKSGRDYEEPQNADFVFCSSQDYRIEEIVGKIKNKLLKEI